MGYPPSRAVSWPSLRTLIRFLYLIQQLRPLQCWRKRAPVKPGGLEGSESILEPSPAWHTQHPLGCPSPQLGQDPQSSSPKVDAQPYPLPLQSLHPSLSSPANQFHIWGLACYICAQNSPLLDSLGSHKVSPAHRGSVEKRTLAFDNLSRRPRAWSVVRGSEGCQALQKRMRKGRGWG